MIHIKSENDLYSMSFHDVGCIIETNNVFVVRVPGGWLYTTDSATTGETTGLCFVPWAPQMGGGR